MPSSFTAILLNHPEVKRLLYLIIGWLMAASLTLGLTIALWWSIQQKEPSSPEPVVAEFEWTKPSLTAKEWPLSLESSLRSIDDIEAKAVILVDESNGQILASRQADRRLAIASTTKIMTAIVALEYGDLTSFITVDGAWLTHLPADSTTMGLSDGEQYRLEELLQGLLLGSGNDAAMIIASAISARPEDFVALMNAKAEQYGLTNTHFANPVGLDDVNNYSTASDLAILAHQARQWPIFRQIVGRKSVSLPYSSRHKALTIDNLNTMIGSYEGVTGIKPGNTEQAGNCLVVSYTKAGKDYLAVLLDTPARSTNMAKLLDKIP